MSNVYNIILDLIVNELKDKAKSDFISDYSYTSLSEGAILVRRCVFATLISFSIILTLGFQLFTGLSFDSKVALVLLGLLQFVIFFVLSRIESVFDFLAEIGPVRMESHIERIEGYARREFNLTSNVNRDLMEETLALLQLEKAQITDFVHALPYWSVYLICMLDDGYEYSLKQSSSKYSFEEFLKFKHNVLELFDGDIEDRREFLQGCIELGLIPLQKIKDLNSSR